MQLTRRALLKASLGFTALSLVGCGGNTATAVAPPLAPLEQLARSLRGSLLLPGEAGYAGAALPWNLRFADILPTAIAMCESAEDVRTSLLWAQDNGVPLVARSGGHSYAGYSCTTGLMINLTRMNGFAFDGQLATFGGGARNQDVYNQLPPLGRALPHGRCPPVGLAGLTLGGGIGFDMRLRGLTIDELVATEVVLADGQIVHCSESENPDLFWACRGGGGGNFGINTSFTYRTYPVGNETAFQFCWTDQLDALLPLLLELLPTLPRAFGAKVTVGNDGSEVEIELLGQLQGTPQELQAMLAPVLAFPTSMGVVEPLSYWDAQLFLSEPDATDYSHEKSRYLFDSFDAAAASPVILDFVRAWPGTGASANWKVFLTGGAVADIPPEATAYFHRGAIYLSSIELDWLATTPPEVVALNQAWQDDFFAAMAAFGSNQSYLNFADEGLTDFLTAYYGGNLPRLIEVKRRYDPRDVFRFAQGVPLA